MARNTEFLREYESKRIVGILETETNGDQTLREYPSRRILGYYRAKQNVTTDLYGRKISDGNTLSSLAYRGNGR